MLSSLIDYSTCSFCQPIISIYFSFFFASWNILYICSSLLLCFYHLTIFFPQWRKGLKLSGEAAVEKITLDGVKGLRVMLGATAHDVLYYMSPIYCQDIINSVEHALFELLLSNTFIFSILVLHSSLYMDYALSCLYIIHMQLRHYQRRVNIYLRYELCPLIIN